MIDNSHILTCFPDLNEEEVLSLMDISTLRQYLENEIIFYEGDGNENLIYLLNGEVKSYKTKDDNSQIFLFLSRNNELITDISCFECLHSSFTAKCTKDSLTLNINFSKVKSLKNANVLLNIIKSFSVKTSKVYNFIDMEFSHNSIQKVAQMILLELDLFNSLKKIQIAKMLNIKPETLSRILQKLIKEEVISYTEHKDIIILKNIKLQNIIMTKIK